MNTPIDLVVTWVDGNDPEHKLKRNKYQKFIEENATTCGTLDWRFIDVNEIEYCIYSVRKFAPWIRNIYLVTDNQCPAWLSNTKKAELGVTLVDHKVLFNGHSQYLPTFNTMSINSLFWRIPEISNQYISLNDDMFFIDNVNPTDFFINDCTVIRGYWNRNKLTFSKKIKRIIKEIMHNQRLPESLKVEKNLHINAALILGFSKKHFVTQHAPHTYRKDVLSEFYNNNLSILEDNIKYRFRNKEQTLSSELFTHLILKQDKAIIHDGNDAEMIIPRYGGLKDQRPKFDALKRGNHGKKILCFQDLAFLKQENPEEFQEVIDWLEETIMK